MGRLISSALGYSISGNHEEALRRPFLQTAPAHLRAIALSDLAIFADDEQVKGFFNPPFHRKAMDSNGVAGTGGGHLVPS